MACPIYWSGSREKENQAETDGRKSLNLDSPFVRNSDRIAAEDRMRIYEYIPWERVLSRQAVATVDQQIRTGRVTRRVRGKVQKSTFQLVRLTLSAHGDLASPYVLGLSRGKVG